MEGQLGEKCNWIGSCGTSFYYFYILYSMSSWSLDWTSCHWIRNVIQSGQQLFKKVCFPEHFSRYVSANMAADVQGQHWTAQEQLTASDIKTVLLDVMNQNWLPMQILIMACASWSGCARWFWGLLNHSLNTLTNVRIIWWHLGNNWSTSK